VNFAFLALSLASSASCGETLTSKADTGRPSGGGGRALSASAAFLGRGTPPLSNDTPNSLSKEGDSAGEFHVGFSQTFCY